MMTDPSEYCEELFASESWTLFYPERPWTVNAERTWHHMKRAKIVREWRDAFCWLAREAKIPRLRSMVVHVTPTLPDKRMQDVAACLGAAKAAIDGITDAGVLPEDSPQYVHSLTFHAPLVDKTNAGLSVVIFGEPE